jgi:hypothetical protein
VVLCFYEQQQQSTNNTTNDNNDKNNGARRKQVKGEMKIKNNYFKLIGETEGQKDSISTNRQNSRLIYEMVVVL